VLQAFSLHGIGEADDEISIGVHLSWTESPSMPDMLTVENAYPNPFSDTAQIRFHLSSPTDVHVRVFDAAGRQVADLLNRFLGAGNHKTSWRPNQLPSGSYFFEIATQSSIKRGSTIYVK
jgi:hypothetical protein